MELECKKDELREIIRRDGKSRRKVPQTYAYT